MKLFDVQHPFFRPLWRRVLLVAACLGWTTVEVSNGETLWATLFGAIGGYLAWQFFVVFDPAPGEGEDEGRGDRDGGA